MVGQYNVTSSTNSSRGLVKSEGADNDPEAPVGVTSGWLLAYILVFIGFAMSSAIEVVAVNRFWLATGNSIHNKMLARVMGSPMSFI